MSDNRQDKLKKQMKQRLENMPRYNYKAVGYFTSLENMQKTIDELTNKGIMDLNSKTLSENYVEEIYENRVFFKSELYVFLNSFIIGGIIGAVLGGLLGRQDIVIPLLNPVLAGGREVSIFLGFFLGALLSSTMIGILNLHKPFSWIGPGYHMLTVYSDTEKKQQIQNILKKFSAIQQ